MAGNNNVGGRATISTPSMGVIRSKPGATLKMGGLKREPQVDDQGYAGPSYTHVEGTIDATFTQKAGVSVAAINAIDGEDISFETDTGSHHVLRNASCDGEATLKAGEIAAKFFGGPCDEVTA